MNTISSLDELTEADLDLARSFFYSACGSLDERIRIAVRHTGYPAWVFRHIERVDNGEDEDPDEEALRLFETVSGMPSPAGELLDPADKRMLFIPAPEMTAWMTATFVSKDGPLTNKEHKHLVYAPPAVLWTNLPNKRGGKPVAGTACMPGLAKGDPWTIAQRQCQLIGWFDKVPTFLITLDARYWAEADLGTRLALCEHEMSHCGQKRDRYNQPMFSRENGKPLFGMRGHDVEVFKVEWERYGPGCSAGESPMLFELGKRGPTVTAAQIARACGTCR